MNQPVTLAMTGDVMLGRAVDEALLRFGPAHPWGDLRLVLNEADLTIVNLECVIARGGEPWSRWPKAFHFRADPVAVRALQLAGIDCVTLANNHVLDYEEEALLEMLELLRQAGIAFAAPGAISTRRGGRRFSMRPVCASGSSPSPTTNRIGPHNPARRGQTTSRSRSMNGPSVPSGRAFPRPKPRGPTWWFSRSTGGPTRSNVPAICSAGSRAP